jgi:hypothetical protein
MSRIRLALWSMLPVLAISAAISSSASALKSCGSTETKEPVVCAESEKGETKEFEGKLGRSQGSVEQTSELKSKLLGVKWRIECRKLNGTIQLKDSNTASTKVTFEECRFVEPKTCKLSAKQEKEIVVEAENESVGKGEVRFKGARSSETFVELEIEGCVKEALQVTGSQKCALEKPEVPEHERTLVCTTSGSEIKLGREKAEFESTGKGIEVIGGIDSELEEKWFEGES